MTQTMVACTTAYNNKHISRSRFQQCEASSIENSNLNYLQRINELKQELKRLNILEHSRRIIEIYNEIQELQAEMSKAIPD